MAKYKGKYRIESNRAHFWDYSASADYFITICVANRECIFGQIINGIMVYSEYGKIVQSEIIKIPEYHKRVILDEWVVMPNHIHAIITLGDYDYDNGVSMVGGHGDVVEKIHEFSLRDRNRNHPPTTDEIKQYRKHRRKMLIPKILGKFKHQTSKQINILRNTPGVKNWQSNYHDHIIRNIKSYHNIKNYIINNPAKWQADKFNPKNPNSDE